MYGVCFTLQVQSVQLSLFHTSLFFRQCPSASTHFPEGLCLPPVPWQWCSSFRILRRSCLMVFWNSSSALSMPSMRSSSTSSRSASLSRGFTSFGAGVVDGDEEIVVADDNTVLLPGTTDAVDVGLSSGYENSADRLDLRREIVLNSSWLRHSPVNTINLTLLECLRTSYNFNSRKLLVFYCMRCHIVRFFGTL